MLSRLSIPLTSPILSVILSVSAFGQMGSGPPVSPSPPATARSRGSSVSPAAIIGGVVGAAAIGYLTKRGHHRNYIVGCVASSGAGNTMMNEKDSRTYTLLAGNGLRLLPGERVKLYGKKIRRSRRLIFDAQELAHDYGACPL